MRSPNFWSTALGTPTSEAAIQVPPTLFLTDDDVAQLADWVAAFSALRTAYASAIAPAMIPPRAIERGGIMAGAIALA